MANLRREDTHQLTTGLVRDHDVIVIEDLHVAGMLRNRRLARHIADASWAQIRRQLSDRTARAGVRLVVADRWYASSKTCSQCGTARAKLALSERTFACMSCGSVLDRDHNAALNPAASRRPTPASCAGSCPMEPMSDGTGLPGPQSDRHGKAESTVNAIAARRWLDERDRTSRFIERFFETLPSAASLGFSWRGGGLDVSAMAAAAAGPPTTARGARWR